MARKKRLVFESPFDHYREVDVLGEGGAGRVFKVEDNDGKLHALKCLDPNKITKEKVKRFQNELFFCSRNQHKNIVQVVDWGDVDVQGAKCPFYVMPLYSQTLRTLIANGIAHDQVLHLFGQILDGVEAAHLQKVWHRDLKPENILYDESTNRLVIADFGIARFSEEFLRTSVKTKTGTRLANFQYASPEQRESGSVDHRADIYALGMILNEMFTGTLLQGTGYKTIAIVSQGYSYLDPLVELMIRQAPADRPNSVDEIKKELIGRQNEFISRQKLSELRKTVIPESELDDPFINDPVTLIGIDYVKGDLILKLSQRVTSQWVEAFKTISNYTFYPGREPSYFQFREGTASIPVGEQYVQQVTDLSKDYVSKANENYKRIMLEQKRQREAMEKRMLQEKIAEEETRQRILKSVKV